GSATITVQLNGTPSQSVTVHYQTSDGTGKAGTDYTSVSGTLTFSAGVSSRSFTVPILDDNALNESNETVNLTLSSPSGASLGTPSSATLTIQEDSDLAAVQFSSASYSVNETAGSITVGVQLSASVNQTVTVPYQVNGGTAVPGVDFSAASGILTFSAGV